MVALELALPDVFVAGHKNIKERQQQGAVAAPDRPYKTNVDMPIRKKGNLSVPTFIWRHSFTSYHVVVIMFK